MNHRRVFESFRETPIGYGLPKATSLFKVAQVPTNSGLFERCGARVPADRMEASPQNELAKFIAQQVEERVARRTAQLRVGAEFDAGPEQPNDDTEWVRLSSPRGGRQ